MIILTYLCLPYPIDSAGDALACLYVHACVGVLSGGLL